MDCLQCQCDDKNTTKNVRKYKLSLHYKDSPFVQCSCNNRSSIDNKSAQVTDKFS